MISVVLSRQAQKSRKITDSRFSALVARDKIHCNPRADIRCNNYNYNYGHSNSYNYSYSNSYSYSYNYSGSYSYTNRYGFTNCISNSYCYSNSRSYCCYCYSLSSSNINSNSRRNRYGFNCRISTSYNSSIVHNHVDNSNNLFGNCVSVSNSNSSSNSNSNCNSSNSNCNSSNSNSNSSNSNSNSKSSSNSNNKIVVRQVFGEERHTDYLFIDNRDRKGIRTSKSESVSNSQRAIPIDSKDPLHKRLRHLYTDITSYFLPKGYPQSVGNGYGTFVRGQMLSTLLSSAGGVLSMQSLLYAVGLGSGAIPLAATLNWILKDGLGQLGGVIFASQVSNKFDSDPKRWRMVSALSLEVSSLIELCTPLVPMYFLPLASVANIGKNISYLAASASRAAIHKSFAINNNLADLTAKTGSQSILSSLLGTSLGISIASLAATTDHQYLYTFIFFTTCSSLSLVATHSSLQIVTINTLSLERLEYLLQHYFSLETSDKIKIAIANNNTINNNNSNNNNNNNTIKHDNNEDSDRLAIESIVSTITKCNHKKDLMSPVEMRQYEKFLGVPLLDLDRNSSLVVGAKLSTAFTDYQHFEDTINIFQNELFIISLATVSYSVAENLLMLKPTVSDQRIVLYLLYKENAKVTDMIKGLVVAHVIRIVISKLNLMTVSHEKGLQMIKDVVHNLNISDSSEFSEETTTAKGQSDWIDDLIHKVNSSTEWSLSPSSLEPVLARVKEIKI